MANIMFPKDCPGNCQYFRRWDLSIDDYTNVCDHQHIQVDDMDAYGPFYLPRFCLLSDKEQEKLLKESR